MSYGTYRQDFSRCRDSCVGSGLFVELERVEHAARAKLSPEVYNFVAGSAGTGQTTRANCDAFESWRIVPRMLRNNNSVGLRTTLFERRLPTPLMLAPIGAQRIVHPEGELATARAAASVNVPMILSASSSFDIETVAAASHDGGRWFQLYRSNDDEHTMSVLRRARTAGYSVLVVTIDNPVIGWRPADIDGGYSPFARGLGMEIYFSDPVFRGKLKKAPEEDLAAAIALWYQIFDGHNHGWEGLSFLRKYWDGPIIVKGIQHPDDALQALKYGMDGVIVSNHGGRQVDGAVASLDALPAVVDALAGRAEVLFDSGIRTGADIIKALALGASAVLIGRPYIWGLACGGEAGIAHVLRTLLAEVEITLGLIGCSTVDELDRKMLRR